MHPYRLHNMKLAVWKKKLRAYHDIQDSLDASSLKPIKSFSDAVADVAAEFKKLHFTNLN